MRQTPADPRHRFLSLFYILAVGAVGLVDMASAKPWWLRGSEASDQDFLPPDVAFRVGAQIDGEVVRLRWVIADGYYLYRSKMEVRAESPDLLVGALSLPPGTRLNDPYFGAQEVYQQGVEASVPITRLDYGAHPVQVKVTYQGCAHAGLCYPPITKVLFPTSPTEPTTGSLLGSASLGGVSQAAQAPPGSASFEKLGILGGIAAFLLAGLLLRKDRRLTTPKS
jgi:thiol:disulfide interchange protein DsbD